MRATRLRARVIGGMGALALAASALVSAPSAGAQGGSLDSPVRSDFYQPPADFTSTAPANGDLVRSEPMPLAFSVADMPGPIPAQAQRIMYRSTGATGAPTAVTGVFMKSTRPWTGKGPRPVAVVAPGTQGQGDNCAPSKSFQTLANIQSAPPSVGVGYELISAWALTDAGFDVAVTDYEGLGTPGVHPYVDRRSEGQSVLDAARAAIRLPGSGHGADTPVVFSGYSQGGGAAAAAAELAASYAPELKAVGANAAAPPADLLKVLNRIDGSLIAGAIGYAINSFTTSHPELRPILDAKLNDRGKAMLGAVAEQCIGETILGFGLQNTTMYTVDGRPASQVLPEIPEVVQLLEDQRIGRVRPSMPVRVQGNRNDDAVEFSQVEDLAHNWCTEGATVDFRVDETPPILPRSVVNHLLPMLTHQQEVVGYLTDRVNGVPAPSTCGGAPVQAAGSSAS